MLLATRPSVLATIHMACLDDGVPSPEEGRSRRSLSLDREDPDPGDLFLLQPWE